MCISKVAAEYNNGLIKLELLDLTVEETEAVLELLVKIKGAKK